MKRMVILPIWIFMLTSPVHTALGYTLDRECILFVEPGDSYIKLFGNDWLRVYKTNDPIIFHDSRGKPTKTPEKLVVGMKLIIPVGTQVTEFAKERLSRYDAIRREGLSAIREAEILVDNAPQRSSELYGQGKHFLEQAQKMATEVTYGFANHLDARRLAEEAARCFRANLDIHNANSRIEAMSGQIAQQRSLAEQWQESFKRQRLAGIRLLAMAVSIFVLVLAAFLFLFVRQRRRERAMKQQTWLNNHLSRLKRLEEEA